MAKLETDEGRIPNKTYLNINPKCGRRQKAMFSVRAMSCFSDLVVLPALMHVETLSIRISKSERAALRAAARREKISQGQIVRKALHAYGIKPKEKTPVSAYDLVKDLIGRQSGGPTDLSTNPKYMEGFGR